MYTLIFSDGKKLKLNYNQLSRSKTLLNMISNCDDEIEILDIVDIVDNMHEILKGLLKNNKICKNISHDKLSTVIDFFDIDHDLQLILTLLAQYSVLDLCNYFNIDVSLTNCITAKDLYNHFKRNYDETFPNDTVNKLYLADKVTDILNNVIVRNQYVNVCKSSFNLRLAYYATIDDIIKFGSKVSTDDENCNYQVIGCGFLPYCGNNCQNHRFLAILKESDEIAVLNLVDGTESTINLPKDRMFYYFSQSGRYLLYRQYGSRRSTLLDLQTNDSVSLSIGYNVFYNDTVVTFYCNNDNLTQDITITSINNTWEIQCNNSEYLTYLPKHDLLVIQKIKNKKRILEFIGKNSKLTICIQSITKDQINKVFNDSEEHFLFIDNNQCFIIDLQNFEIALYDIKQSKETIILFPKSLSPLAIDYARHKLSWKNYIID